MGKSKNKVYVVSLIYEGKKYYLVSKEARNQGRVFLSNTDLKDAQKFLCYDLAATIAALYKGAIVEAIKEGEVLK